MSSPSASLAGAFRADAAAGGVINLPILSPGPVPTVGGIGGRIEVTALRHWRAYRRRKSANVVSEP
ncbi:hypothetical protein [Lonsdalea iberica]|uniref:hypothetical protein n=1 Tax=Lonsdalea iberica TaxID=1082703 RepID=UPI00111BDABB|nr:hypothetical protein [Lonsdalea iberica]